MHLPGPIAEPSLRLHGRPCLVPGGAAADQAPLWLADDARGRLLVLLGASPLGLERSAVCTTLWPDLDPPRARARLRKLLFQIGRAGRPGDGVGPSFASIVVAGTRLRWPVHTDVQWADRLVQRGEFGPALQLTAEPLAFGFETGGPFGEWLLPQRHRAQRLWRERLLLALAPGPAGTPAIADALARSLIDEALIAEPFDEPLVRERLRRIAHRDGPVAARLAYEDWSDRVRAEFGRGAGFDLEPLLGQPAALESAVAPLPRAAHRFFGRSRELARLDSGWPGGLCSAWGPPGIGKSRLALEWALRHRQAGGAVAWLALDTIEAGDGSLASSIAQALGLAPGAAHESTPAPLRPQPAVARLIDQLRERPALVLVLDHADHLADRADDLALLTLLLQSTPLRILYTSRVRLGLAGETVLELGGLAVAAEDSGTPGSADDTTGHAAKPSDALGLLLDRAGLAADAADTVAQQPQLNRLCELSHGHPLALELAARQLRRVGLDRTLSLVQHDLDALRAEEHGVPLRQRSLRAAFDSLLAGLSAPLLGALTALAPLRADFDRSLAAAVLPEPDDLLAELVDRSLLAFDPLAARYRWQPFLREFALARLRSDPQREQRVRLALAHHWAERLTTANLHEASPDPMVVKAVARDWPHLLEAWRSAAAAGALALWPPLAEAVALHAEFTAQCHQGAAWLEPPASSASSAASSAADAPTPQHARAVARVRLLQARLLHWCESERALALLDAADPVLDAQADIEGRIASARVRGVVQWRRGDAAGAAATLRAALELGRSSGATRLRAILLDGLGLALAAQGEHEAARTCWIEALALNEALPNPYQAVQNRINLALGRSTVHAGGDTGRVEVALAEQALAQARAIGYRQFVAHAWAALACTQFNRGDASAAAAAAEQARAEAHGSGDNYVECWALALCARAALAQGLHGTAADAAASGLDLAAAADDLPLLTQHASLVATWADASVGPPDRGAADPTRSAASDLASELAAACATHPALPRHLRDTLRMRLGPREGHRIAEPQPPWPAARLLHAAQTLLQRRWLPPA